jgi:hypothetical protein
MIQLLDQSLEGHIMQWEHSKEVFEDIIAGIAVQMVEAIKEVHSTGRIQRGIKPEKFLLH